MPVSLLPVAFPSSNADSGEHGHYERVARDLDDLVRLESLERRTLEESVIVWVVCTRSGAQADEKKERKRKKEKGKKTRRGNSLALVSRELRAINTFFFPGKQCSDTGRKINEARAKFKLISILLFPLRPRRLSSSRFRTLSLFLFALGGDVTRSKHIRSRIGVRAFVEIVCQRMLHARWKWFDICPKLIEFDTCWQNYGSKRRIRRRIYSGSRKYWNHVGKIWNRSENVYRSY